MQLSDVTSPSNSENKPKNLWLNPNTNTFVVIEPQQDTFTETPPSTTASTADAASGSDAAIVKILSELLAVDALKQQKEDVQPPTVDAPATPQLGKSFRDELKDGSLGPEVVLWIPGGTFQMGSNEYDSEKPVHTVTVKSFGMGKYEVTRGEFRKFVEATSYKTEAEKGDGCYGWTGSDWKKDSAYNWKNVGFTQDDKHPAVCVSWNDAKAYVKWLSEQTGKDYRLPSEAQWEYVCRAGSMGKYSFGDDVNQLGDYGWYGKNSDNKTHPVGEKQANKFRLYDMHGNVWEWLEDVWHSDYNGAPGDGSAWMSGDSNTRLLHGGSWSLDDDSLRCAFRVRDVTSSRYNNWGFRISRVNL